MSHLLAGQNKTRKKNKKEEEREKNNFKSQDGYCAIDQGYFWQYILGHVFSYFSKK